ncbi:MAG: DUF255 domain-containing protein, partial [Myxococcaceae bacterium]|nr:DUF255 domain-containing protein [Myxococcaceae bacterium]
MRPLFLVLALSACAHGASSKPVTTPDWQPWSKETFERAKAEGRYLLVDCSAEWCHWCHVMDDTTYKDARILAALDARFVPVRVDVDARPDLAERYGEWGWPATVLLSPEAQELGKFRGYLPPERLVEILGSIEARAAEGT